MRRIFLDSLLFKAGISGVGIVRILTDNILFALLQCILQIVFMMWVISCMNEYTYKCSWAKMEFEIEDKKIFETLIHRSDKLKHFIQIYELKMAS